VRGGALQAVVAAAQKRVFDVNLREPFVDQEAILACMQVGSLLPRSSSKIHGTPLVLRVWVSAKVGVWAKVGFGRM